VSVGMWVEDDFIMSDIGVVDGWHQRGFEVDPFPIVLFGKEYVHAAIKEPQCHRGVSLAVTLQPLSEQIDEYTELRMFAHVTARNGAWTWELFPAHWTDIPDECPAYIGRWPD
jgi:hypothetical protein